MQERQGDIMAAVKHSLGNFCLASACLVAVVGGLSLVIAAPTDGNSSPVEFTPDGKLKQPVGYREWEYVGTPLTPNELNGGEAPFPDFHIVYLDPDSFAHYKKTGKFRDGAVVVKELVAIGSKEASSGKGYFMGDYIGLETAVKDSKRFKDEPGNWGYFTFGHKYPLKTVTAAESTAACNSCHQNNAASDWVFSQYYPVLRAAHPSAN
jgi:hypothetical protein